MMARLLDWGMKRNDSDDNSFLKLGTDKLVIKAHKPPKIGDITINVSHEMDLPSKNQSGSDSKAAMTTCSRAGIATLVAKSGKLVATSSIGGSEGRVGMNPRGGRVTVRTVTTDDVAFASLGS